MTRNKFAIVLAAFMVLMFSALGMTGNITVTQAAENSLYERSLFGTITAPTVDVKANWDTAAASLGILEAGQRIIVLGRNEDNFWLYFHSYLGYGYALASSIKVSGDVHHLAIADPNMPTTRLPKAIPVEDPQLYPILPKISDYAHEIFKRGQSLGINPAIFTKVGDCMTADRTLYMGYFGTPNYDLGNYKNTLQEVVDFYNKQSPRKGSKNSFLNESYATHTGFNASSVEDPAWLDSAYCAKDDSPLSCEYDLTKPGVAVIMFGTNDIEALTAVQFDFFLRLVVADTIARGTIPVLSTFPGEPILVDQANVFNQIIYSVGQDYDIPVMNLWLALQTLPNHGRIANSMYLSHLLRMNTAFFSDKNLRYGHTLRNLITLQTLDLVWRQVIKPASNS